MPTIEQDPRRPGYRELLAAYERARETYERDPGQHSLTVLETGLAILVQELHKPGKFDLGQMAMTPGADRASRDARQVPLEFLAPPARRLGRPAPRRPSGPTGRLQHSARLFSALPHPTPTTRLWVITEADRSVTTLLLPEEY